MRHLVTILLLAGCPRPSEPPVAATPHAASELEITDLVVGTGELVEPGTRVTVHYDGWLTDGTLFDSSRQRNQPFQFDYGEGYVIAGWEQGLVGMREGGRRKLVIPPDLAYGDRGAGADIAPGATLVFEIELLDVAAPRVGPAEPLPDVVYATTASGLQIAHLIEGTGPAPAPGGVAVVEYTGWLESGAMFDSSYSRRAPTEFPVSRVIPGVTETLLAMKVGGKAQVRIPPELAYGDRGHPPVIPPAATLIFQIELLDVKPD